MHVISGLGLGGAETVLFRLISNSEDFDHEVVCLGPPDWFSSRLETLDIQVRHLDYPVGVGPFMHLFSLFRLMKSSDADLVQCWMYRGNLFGGVSARLAGKPSVWNIRSSTLAPLRLASRALALISGQLTSFLADYVINCSVESARLHGRLGYDAIEGRVIPNGFDPTEFYPDAGDRAELRRALGLRADAFVIGSFGRWHRQKGYPQLFEALRILRQRNVPACLLVAGSAMDSNNAQLTRLIADSGCEDLVELIGQRSDIPAIARAVDLHVLASIGAEGFPNVVAETMLSGCPNVVTEVGDASLIVRDTGWVVPPGDTRLLADAIEQAYREWRDESEEWQARRMSARRRIVKNFTVGRMVEAYEQVWTKFVESQLRSKQSAETAVFARTAHAPLRVVHIINSLGLGGAETLLYRLATSKSSNNHVIVSLGRSAWYSVKLQEEGVPVHHLDIEGVASVPGGIMRLNKVLRAARPHVVQCWMYRSNVFGGLVAKAAGRPVVWGIHCSSLEPLKLSSRLLARLGGVLARSTPNFIINCSARSAELHQKIGYPARKGGVVHNGYDPAAFFADEPVRLTARGDLGIGTDDFVIATIARWHAQKDIPNFLAALRMVHDRGVPFRGYLIGPGLSATDDPLSREITRSGCEGLVTPLGRRSDIHELSQAIDLHVLASCGAEAFPNVVAETMLSQTPNVVTDVGDAALMVGTTGWVVPPRDPTSLADAIVEAYGERMRQPNQWTKRRISARKQIAENFTFVRMAEEYERIWRQVALSQ